MSAAPQIALFGGTFDPVHNGHIAMAQAARDAFHLDQVRFIPCQISPHKQQSVPTAAADRLKMLQLATSDLPWAVVDDIEALREGPSYSWLTAQTMRARYPDARLYWIMGSDQWSVLMEWTHPERIAECCEFIVFARKRRPLPRDGYRLHVLDDIHPASASRIRKELREGSHDTRWIHPEVAGWIRRQGLYPSDPG